jgi:hypothetical protein
MNIDFSRLSKKEQEAIIEIVVKNNALKIGGASKAKITEDRFRSVIGESRPSTTNYDFASGEGTFFNTDRVELKQFTGQNNWKAQQVKPLLYDKVLMCREEKDASFWFVVKTELISSKVSTLQNRYKEPGKLRLNGQHKGNLHEGMIGMDKNTKAFIKGKCLQIIPSNKDEWSDLVTFIGKFPPLNYSKEDLGLDDSEVLSILTFVKNH